MVVQKLGAFGAWGAGPGELVAPVVEEGVVLPPLNNWERRGLCPTKAFTFWKPLVFEKKEEVSTF